MSRGILLDDFYITNVEVPVQATNFNIPLSEEGSSIPPPGSPVEAPSNTRSCSATNPEI